MRNLQRFAGDLFVGATRHPADKSKVVQVFDVDSTLTSDPYGPRQLFNSKDAYFDAARDFPANKPVVELAQLLEDKGDRIAIATARPPERLQETIEWLDRNNVPFDQVILSTGEEASGVAKQAMLQKLQDEYRMVGTLFDDSKYNIEGANLQGIDSVHLRTNDQYWEAHPELVYRYSR